MPHTHEMKRKRRDESVERFWRRKARDEARPLRERLARWARANVDALRDAEPELPEALDDRAADVWEPLLAIADRAGGDWPQRARRAALALSAGDARVDRQTKKSRPQRIGPGPRPKVSRLPPNLTRRKPPVRRPSSPNRRRR